MFGALIIPAAAGALIGTTKTGQRVWPGVTLTKGALLVLGAIQRAVCFSSLHITFPLGHVTYSQPV